MCRAIQNAHREPISNGETATFTSAHYHTTNRRSHFFYSFDQNILLLTIVAHEMPPNANKGTCWQIIVASDCIVEHYEFSEYKSIISGVMETTDEYRIEISLIEHSIEKVGGNISMMIASFTHSY